MKYLIYSDLLTKLNVDDINLLFVNYKQTDKIEAQTLETIRSMLSNIYNLDEMLRPFKLFVPNELYFLNDRVYDEDNDEMYLVIVDEGFSTDINDVSVFRKEDDRQVYLTDIILDVFLFKMFSLFENDSVSEFRRINYEDAIEKLKSINSGKQSLTGSTTKFVNNKINNNKFWGSKKMQSFSLFPESAGHEINKKIIDNNN